MLLCCACAPASAQDFSVHGFADFRLAAAPDETSWSDGGLGKTRYGDGDTSAHFGAAAIVANWQFAPAWLAVADVRMQPHAGSAIALSEAFLRFRPVSTSPWRWSLKAGEFFAPISLENDGIGWTSLWTLTPSAIDSWVGEELRTLGGELRVEHRNDWGSIECAVAAFRGNHPAAEIIPSRGSALADWVSRFGRLL